MRRLLIWISIPFAWRSRKIVGAWRCEENEITGQRRAVPTGGDWTTPPWAWIMRSDYAIQPYEVRGTLYGPREWK
jgi:hypothetical protein